MSDLVASLIRTAVPALFGTAVAWLAVRYGIVIDDTVSAQVATILAGLAIVGWYALGRAVEQRWPGLGKYLLSAGLTAAKPHYAEPDPARPGEP